MSHYTAWAAKLSFKNKNQRDLMNFLAERADEEGRARATAGQIITGCEDITTPRQVETALRGLMDGGLVTKAYDMDTYTFVYTLHVR